MSDTNDTLAVSLFSEIFVVDQLARGQLTKALPKGMEISHFSVLNHLAHIHDERSPAQLARAFNVTRGAMTNTLQKLENAGHIHIRPDWDDARRKFVAISPSGVSARDAAIAAIAPLVTDVVNAVGADKVRTMLPVLRELRIRLSDDD
jgi:DNA-binding MarR family transcriptional regulator